MENVTVQSGKDGVSEQLTEDNWEDLTDGIAESKGGVGGKQIAVMESRIEDIRDQLKGYVKEVPDPAVVKSEIVDTDIVTSGFRVIGTGSDGRTYFCGEYIYVLDPDTGKIVEMAYLQSYVVAMGIGSDGRTYFCNSYGIYVLNEAGNNVSFIVAGDFRVIGTGSDGRTYFCGAAGIFVLDRDTGSIVKINTATAIIGSMGIGSDGRTYFGGTGSTRRLYVLDEATGVPVSAYAGAGIMCAIGIGSDGRTYFVGTTNITDITAYINTPDETTGALVRIGPSASYRAMGTGSDGKTYFLHSAGIRVLNDMGGVTGMNVTGDFRAMGIGSDGRTYFVGAAGVYVLDPGTGDIVPTNVTAGDFYSVGIGSDGRTYFGNSGAGGNLGIKTLEITYTNEKYLRRHGEWDKYEPEYIFATEAEFEAAKDSIPVGATVVKLYEYPSNGYSTGRPDLWPVGVEIDFGGGLFGRRLTGTSTSTGSRTAIGIFNYKPTSFKFVNCGGGMALSNNDPDYIYQQSFGSSDIIISQDNTYGVVLDIPGGNRTNAPYDVWITYSK
jgi:hypothetical protein